MDFISADDFPFTADELRRALALAYPADQAARLSAHIIALGQGRNEQSHPPLPQSEYSRAHTATDNATILIPPSTWALLAASSASLEQRCEEWRRRNRLVSRAAREGAARQEHGLAMNQALPSELTSRWDEEDTAAEQEWTALLGQARTLLAKRTQ